MGFFQKAKRGRNILILTLAVLILFLLYGAFQDFILPPTGEVIENSVEVIDTNGDVYRIKIIDFRYMPSEIFIKKGDTIIWKNEGTLEHTVTSKNSNELFSDFLKPDEEYSHTFEYSGNYSYYCIPHPYMKGLVVVR